MTRNPSFDTRGGLAVGVAQLISALPDVMAAFSPSGLAPADAERHFLMQLRAGSAHRAAGDPTVATEDVELDGLRIRLFRPESAGLGAVATWFHGGGFVSGSVDAQDHVCRFLSAASGSVIASVGYRLAPEHPYPAAFDDCVAATTWLAAQAAELTGQPRPVVVMGSSAGAALAAAVALAVRSDRLPVALAGHVLLCPVLDASCSAASHVHNADAPILTTAALQYFWRAYAGTTAAMTDPLLSPLAAASLEGLSPGLVVTAEFDPARDDGVTWASRLAADGVPAVHRDFPGQVHGFTTHLAALPDAAVALRLVADFLRASGG
jgi:acetyl esterase